MRSQPKPKLRKKLKSRQAEKQKGERGKAKKETRKKNLTTVETSISSLAGVSAAALAS